MRNMQSYKREVSSCNYHSCSIAKWLSGEANITDAVIRLYDDAFTITKNLKVLAYVIQERQCSTSYKYIPFQNIDDSYTIDSNSS